MFQWLVILSAKVFLKILIEKQFFERTFIFRNLVFGEQFVFGAFYKQICNNLRVKQKYKDAENGLLEKRKQSGNSIKTEEYNCGDAPNDRKFYKNL